jgi:hypothetical protein
VSSVVSAMTWITPPAPSHHKVFVEFTASQWMVSGGFGFVSILFPLAGLTRVASVVAMGTTIISIVVLSRCLWAAGVVAMVITSVVAAVVGRLCTLESGNEAIFLS